MGGGGGLVFSSNLSRLDFPRETVFLQATIFPSEIPPYCSYNGYHVNRETNERKTKNRTTLFDIPYICCMYVYIRIQEFKLREEAAWKSECFGSQHCVICQYDGESFAHSTKISYCDRWGTDWTFCSLIPLLPRSKLHCYFNEVHDSQSNTSEKKSYRKCILR
jgi:hypothetical protein